MTRRLFTSLMLLGSALSLGGCVAGMAASAVGMAARSARGEPASNRHLQPAAKSACSDHASRYGAVHVIDVVQQSQSKIVVWGTADDGKERRSFECSYGVKITGFKLRAIRQQR